MPSLPLVSLHDAQGHACHDVSSPGFHNIDKHHCCSLPTPLSADMPQARYSNLKGKLKDSIHHFQNAGIEAGVPYIGCHFSAPLTACGCAGSIRYLPNICLLFWDHCKSLPNWNSLWTTSWCIVFVCVLRQDWIPVLMLQKGANCDPRRYPGSQPSDSSTVQGVCGHLLNPAAWRGAHGWQLCTRAVPCALRVC